MTANQPVPCNLAIAQSDCTLETCCIQQANLLYRPMLSGNVTYLTIFGVLLLAHATLGIRYRTWFFAAGMGSGLILEVVGYFGRISLYNNPFEFNSFVIYLVCLTLAPALMCASVYLCLGRIITIYGANLSRLRPRTYTITFVFCDLISLILQATGGAVASLADDNPTRDDGVHIMVAGLAFQVFSLTLFMVLCAEFAWRLKVVKDAHEPLYTYLRESRMFRGFTWALAVAVISIFVRCIFRLVELQDGFDGPIANDEVAFMVLEGPMIMIAIIALTIFHPGICFQGQWNTISS